MGEGNCWFPTYSDLLGAVTIFSIYFWLLVVDRTQKKNLVGGRACFDPHSDSTRMASHRPAMAKYYREVDFFEGDGIYMYEHAVSNAVSVTDQAGYSVQVTLRTGQTEGGSTQPGAGSSAPEPKGEL